jgi:hypothetical protein
MDGGEGKAEADGRREGEMRAEGEFGDREIPEQITAGNIMTRIDLNTTQHGFRKSISIF